MTSARPVTNAFYGTQPVATSHYGLGGDTQIVQHVHMMWDATLVATVTLWSSEFGEVLPTNTTAGMWIQENPPSGTYVAFSPSGAGTATGLVITIPGGTAGGCSINIGNLGAEKLKAQVVCTTAGLLRIRAGGKE